MISNVVATSVFNKLKFKPKKFRSIEVQRKIRDSYKKVCINDEKVCINDEKVCIKDEKVYINDEKVCIEDKVYGSR